MSIGCFWARRTTSGGRSEAPGIIALFRVRKRRGYKRSLDFIFLLQSVRKSLKTGFAGTSLPSRSGSYRVAQVGHFLPETRPCHAHGTAFFRSASPLAQRATEVLCNADMAKAARRSRIAVGGSSVPECGKGRAACDRVPRRSPKNRRYCNGLKHLGLRWRSGFRSGSARYRFPFQRVHVHVPPSFIGRRQSGL